MAFTPRWTVAANEKYAELKRVADEAKEARGKSGKTKSSPAEGLFKQVAGCLSKLLANPKHPGLHTHDYSGLEHPVTKGEKVFEAYAQNDTPGAYRVFWCYGPQRKEITIIAITPHP